MKELFVTLSRVRYRTDCDKRVWSFLEDPDLVTGGRLYMNLVSMFILGSAMLPLVQTVDPAPFDPDNITFVVLVLDAMFALEVLVRFKTCPNRVSFVMDGYNVMDFLACILAVIVRVASGGAKAVLLNDADQEGRWELSMMMLCLPVLRLMKLLRRFDSFHLIIKAFRNAMEALPVLIFILAVLVLTFASIIYLVEPRNNIPSLMRAMWLTIVTVGTIGYGDIVPRSSKGSMVVSVLIVVSSLYMAIPLGIVGKAFSAVWDDRDRLLLMHRTRSRFLASGYKAKDIPTMFFSFDVDSDGQLSLAEFLSMMSQLQVEISGPRVVELFETFDMDGSGYIDDHEFVRTLFPTEFFEVYGITDKEQQHRERMEGSQEPPGLPL